MAELNQKLDRFTAAVLSEAAQETDSLLQEIEQRRKQVLSDAEAQALDESHEYLHGQLDRVKAELGQQVSRHMLENKRALALRREEIARGVFAKVVQKVEAYTAGGDYPDRLLALLRQAVQAIGEGSLVVYLRPQDMSLAPRLRQALPRQSVEVRQGSFHLGGLIVDCPEKNLRADQTFDGKLKDLDGHFAELFGLSLPDSGA